MDKAMIIGRVLMQSDYLAAENILSKFKPMLKKPHYVEQIFHTVQQSFPEETMENRRLIFIGVVYQVYQPLSFLENKSDNRVAGKLPPGIRDEMARCLEFVNPEMCNHFKSQIEPWLKPFNTGPERPFKVKVMSIVEKYRCFSINSEDFQPKLF